MANAWTIEPKIFHFIFSFFFLGVIIIFIIFSILGDLVYYGQAIAVIGVEMVIDPIKSMSLGPLKRLGVGEKELAAATINIRNPHIFFG